MKKRGDTFLAEQHVIFLPLRKPKLCMPVLHRENKEGGPPLTVETEANGDSRSTYERGTSLVGS